MNIRTSDETNTIKPDTFESKLILGLYKTAYSPLFHQYVGIEKVYLNSAREPLIYASLAESNERILFRPYELTNYCL